MRWSWFERINGIKASDLLSESYMYWRALYLLCSLVLTPSIALAQSANDIFNIIGGVVRTVQQSTAQSEWNRLPQAERSCIDQNLQLKGLSLETIIGQGVRPSDRQVSYARLACQGPGARQTTQGNQEGGQPSIYTVDGLALGSTVKFESEAYRSYRCVPSEQFAGFTWCQKKSSERNRRGQFTSSYSMLHSSDGAAAYINRYLTPAWFAAGEGDEDITRLSKKYGPPSSTILMPPTSSVPNGKIVVWGDVKLEPIGLNDVRELAAGHDVHAGLMVDHIGNYQRSAQQGLPIYKVTGGAGYAWAASWNQSGTGTLRFFAVDASAISPQVLVNSGSSSNKSVTTAPKDGAAPSVATAAEPATKPLADGSLEIQGKDILEKAQRQTQVQTDRSEVFGSLFKGFPKEALDVRVLGVRADKDNPKLLQITLQIDPNKVWFDKLKVGLAALSVREIEGQKAARCMLPQSVALPRDVIQVCVGTNDNYRNFILPAGNYGQAYSRFFKDFRNEGGGYGWLAISLGFLNKSGSYRSKCFATTLSREGWLEFNYFGFGTGPLFWAASRTFTISVPSDSIDLSQSEKVSAAIAEFAPQIAARNGPFPRPDFNVSFKSDVLADEADTETEFCARQVYRQIAPTYNEGPKTALSNAEAAAVSKADLNTTARDVQATQAAENQNAQESPPIFHEHQVDKNWTVREDDVCVVVYGDEASGFRLIFGQKVMKGEFSIRLINPQLQMRNHPDEPLASVQFTGPNGNIFTNNYKARPVSAIMLEIYGIESGPFKDAFSRAGTIYINWGNGKSAPVNVRMNLYSVNERFSRLLEECRQKGIARPR